MKGSGGLYKCRDIFLSKLKNGEEFEGGLEKRKGKEEKKEKSDKRHVKIRF